MSFQRETEAESPSQLNRVLARARQADQHRQRVLSTKELLTTTRLELGLVGPRVLSQYLGRTFTKQH